jgi:Ni,Fe-hydrogenase I large subunit
MALSDITTAKGGFSAPVSGATAHEVDPISRIEGHLGVHVQVDGTGKIVEADAHGNLWRGFENFLLGRNPNDAITFTQRICGVCPVPHGMTATYAVESVYGLNSGFQTFEQSAADAADGVPRKAMIMRNLILSSEFLMSNITHFYHLAAPSYVQGPAMPPWTPYFNDNDYSEYLLSKPTLASAESTRRALPENGASSAYSKDLWSAVIKSYVHALRIRRLTFEAAGLFAGRMPMTSSYIAGGVTFDHAQDISKHISTFDKLTKEVALFVLKDYVPIVLALGILYPDYDNVNNAHTTGTGKGWGGGLGNFLSWGAFPQGKTLGTLLYQRGTFTGGMGGTLHAGMTVANVEANLTESIARSHYTDPDGDYDATAKNAYPGNVQHTVPDRTVGYSWMKAPRWGTTAMEVGPMARLVINGLYPLPTGGGVLVSDAVNTAWTGAGAAAGPKDAYVNTVHSVVGLKPSSISADIAIGAFRSGLAELWAWDGSAWTCYNTTGTDPVGAMIPTGVGAFTTVNASGVGDGTLESLYADSTTIIWGIIGHDIATMKTGLSTMDRLRARGLETLFLVQIMVGTPVNWGNTTLGGWMHELDLVKSGATWQKPTIPAGQQSGFGGNEAPRGALMHQVTINGGKIVRYQCIVPTTWNGSPKDNAGTRGAIEEAVVGAQFEGRSAKFLKAAEYATAGGSGLPANVNAGTGTAVSGVEPLRIAQSFDPCIACAIH